MKKFDFYGQMVVIIAGLLLSIDFNGMGILFAGLVMFGVGVWQLISTLVNLFGQKNTTTNFFQTNFLIAIGYIIVAVALWLLFENNILHKMEDGLLFIMLAIPPILIFRYWIGISKIYNGGFFKKKIINESL